MNVFGINFPIWVVLFILTLTLLYFYFIWTYDTFNKIGIPGPRPWPIVGNIEDITLGGDAFSWQLKKRYGSVAGIYDGRQPVIKVFDPEILKHIMIKDFSSFTNRPKIPTFDPPLDQSILLLEDEEWKRMRTLMSPFFSTGRLRQMSPQIDACAEILAGNLQPLVGKSVDFLKFGNAFGLGVTARVAFGIETTALNNPDDPIVLNVKKLFQFAPVSLVLACAFPAMADFLRNKLGLRLFIGEPLDFFTKLIDQLVKKRKTHRRENKDFLQLLLDAHGQRVGKVSRQSNEYRSDNEKLNSKKPSAAGLNNTDLTSQTVLFLAAGTETTGKTLVFLCYSLALNLRVQARLMKDIDEVIGETKNLTYDICAQVPYLRQCIYETLRLYPPFRTIIRKCSKDTLIKGIHFPAGVEVDVPLDVIQKDPDYWHEPEKFNPDRFSPQEQASRNPFMWLAFGTGPRNCIGRRLAEMEVEIAAVKLLQRFRFLPCAETEVPIKMRNIPVTLPVRPVTLRIEKRK